ncbi:MAG: hypothetical protein LBP64_05140 [Tannerella sp.]|jgi:hypothetical protein|nr:hypothetical protein [Tannerella sp.]
MVGFRKYVCCTVLFVLLPAQPGVCDAQVSEKVFLRTYRIDSRQNNRLFAEVDNVSFFRNVESPGIIVPGYTLPGLRLQAKAVCYPVSGIRFEGGIHSLWFWGTGTYPASAYGSLAGHIDGRPDNTVHVYPFFRAQVELSEQLHIVMGSLYGGANHRLAEPLYNPELNLIADPETGLQLLYDGRGLHLDTWVNWETFIYRMDTKQEAFSFGISALFDVNSCESAWHVYFPVQALAQHRGGQIDATSLPVQTVLNGSAGVGLDWNVRGKVLKKMRLELNAPVGYQHAGNLWPLKSGYGVSASATVDIMDFRLGAAYWACNDFISIYGNPLFGALSTSVPDAYFIRPRMYSFGGEYTRTFAPGYALGVDFDFYFRPSCLINDPAAGIYGVPSKICYSYGVCLQLNPSFLVKSFGAR